MTTAVIPKYSHYLYALGDRVIRELCDYFNIKLAIYDIDALLEVGKHFTAVIEWKLKRESYDFFQIPSFEYVGLKKVAKCMRCQPYIIIQINEDLNPQDLQNSEFYVIPFNRFENPEQREFKRRNDTHYAIFSPNEGIYFENYRRFRNWLARLILKTYNDFYEGISTRG
jgi:hypothetical protein